MQVFPNSQINGVEGEPARTVRERLVQFFRHRASRLTVQYLAFRSFGAVDRVPCFPTSVLAAGDGALAVAAPTHNSLLSAQCRARGRNAQHPSDQQATQDGSSLL